MRNLSHDTAEQISPLHHLHCYKRQQIHSLDLMHRLRMHMCNLPATNNAYFDSFHHSFLIRRLTQIGQRHGSKRQYRNFSTWAQLLQGIINRRL